MNHKCAYFCGICFSLFCFCAPIFADANDINNPSFELSYPANEFPDFNAPVGWERTDYAAVVSYFNNRGQYWDADFNGLYPYDGNYFVVLSSVDGAGHGESFFSEIRQEITVAANDRITGAYFFGTHDYDPYNDWAVIQLVDDNNNIIGPNIVDVNVTDVNDYGSMRGWKRFDYIFEANQAGTHHIRIAVSDKLDTQLASFFAVDGLVICPNSVIFGDINADCMVNFFDLAMFATDWMCNCNDANVFNDPNHNCIYGTDFDNNGFIDFNDLQVIINYWLLHNVELIYSKAPSVETNQGQMLAAEQFFERKQGVIPDRLRLFRGQYI